MKHLVIGQRQKAPNFSAFHWSPHGSLVSIVQHFITTRVLHLPKRTETSLITESDQIASNHQLCSYAPPAQPSPIRTRLCGPCIAAIAGYHYYLCINETIKMVNLKCNRKHKLSQFRPITLVLFVYYFSHTEHTHTPQSVRSPAHFMFCIQIKF